MFESYYEFRSRLVDALERDLAGPSSRDEIISDPPITRYIAGILFPQNAGTVEASEDLEQDDLGSDDVESGAWDPTVPLSFVRYPSSLGLSFAVDPSSAEQIVVQVSTARYEPQERVADESEADVELLGKRARSQRRRNWRRMELDLRAVRIDVTTPSAGHETELEPGLVLFHRVRKADTDGRVSVTVILINKRESDAPGERDQDSYFQPKLHVASTSDRPAFVHRSSRLGAATEEDIESNQLLYRNAVSLASGHGTAVDWHEDAEDPGRAAEIWTCIVPRFDLPLSDSNRAIPTDALRMAKFVDDPRDLSLETLNHLCESYESWIVETEGEIEALDSALSAAARRHVCGCRKAAARMRAGIALLGNDSDAWEAFRFANRVMHMQRTRSDWLLKGDDDTQPSDDGDHRWRPFQIAFILLCLPGIADPTSEDRDLTDLLWFPTGGGKTEAYLGLLAFTTALRRFRDPVHGYGVTVLMRYTLRLLTIQQFERAALLICCMESVRSKDPRLGSQPIEIGLWVGRAATPNTLAAAKISIDKLRQGVSLTKENPLQLSRCPWCAQALGPDNVWIGGSPRRLVTGCRNSSCAFAHGLPVCVVDEDIYARHPTLVIATADKFASMPWREASRALFNADLRSIAPPELIIQDELHLISGPLGTLTGLYETAIDLMCSLQGRRPKVIASTATIRRAEAQTSGLFARDVRQFPPSGIDARDSFFAREASPDQKGTRLYVGVTAPGTSQTTLLVRTYAAVLQAAAEIEAEDAVKDPYWTVVGYFNSLRVLASARMQVQDDVDLRLDYLSTLHSRKKREIPFDGRIELTSRESSGDIPNHLTRMSRGLPDPQALDLILATNMISVGVDINRLGLMAVMGQPQSTSEYIQATSRVGRQFPGLVVVMLNAAKSRDRSHYESFRDYHAALYRQVESSSVTPFSAQARARGLHAVLVALVRHQVPELRPNEGARHIAGYLDRIQAARQAILDRVLRVDPAEAAEAEIELDEIIVAWVNRAADQPDLVYENHRDPDKALLGDAGIPGEDFRSTFPTVWSLRDVDLSSSLYPVT